MERRGSGEGVWAGYSDVAEEVYVKHLSHLSESALEIKCF
jgi:hypothetical protein